LVSSRAHHCRIVSYITTLCMCMMMLNDGVNDHCRDANARDARRFSSPIQLSSLHTSAHSRSSLASIVHPPHFGLFRLSSSQPTSSNSPNLSSIIAQTPLTTSRLEVILAQARRIVNVAFRLGAVRAEIAGPGVSARKDWNRLWRWSSVHGVGGNSCTSGVPDDPSDQIDNSHSLSGCDRAKFSFDKRGSRGIHLGNILASTPGKGVGGT